MTIIVDGRGEDSLYSSTTGGQAARPRECTRETSGDGRLESNENGFGEMAGRGGALHSSTRVLPLARDPGVALIIRATSRVRLRQRRLTAPPGVPSHRRVTINTGLF